MSITTKTGDEGYTSLLDGTRVHKYDLRIELLGTIDELSSYMGLLKSELDDEEIQKELNRVQLNLGTIMAETAAGHPGRFSLSLDELKNIEELIEKYEGMYIPEKKFIVPGRTRTSALFDICRVVARRAERVIISVDRLYTTDDTAKKYLNRISDYLFTAARYIEFKSEIAERVKSALKEVSNMKDNEEIIKLDKTLNLDTTKKLMEKVEDKAREIGVPVVIAVANEWGNIIAVHFMDGALPGSFNIAVDKAYTSAALRTSTGELGKLSASGQPLQGINTTNNNRIITFGGGFPLKSGRKLYGAIGVSGGTAEEDTKIASYGADIFKEVF